MTSSNGSIFRVTGPFCGEFTGPGEFPAQRPVTRSFDVFFDLRPNKRLSKQPWGWWFETPSWSLWRQCNVRGSPCAMKHYHAVVYTALVSYHFVSLHYGSHFNSLGSDRCGNTFKGMIFKHIIHNCSLGTRCDFALRWMSQNATDDMSTLVWIMARCRQTTNNYLSQCWSISMSPYNVTEP